MGFFRVSPVLRDVGMRGLQWPVLKFDNLIAALEAAPENSPFITFWVDEDQPACMRQLCASKGSTQATASSSLCRKASWPW